MARPLTSREKTIFAVCVLLIFVYGGYNFVFKPLKEEIERLNSQIEVKERKLEKDLSVTRDEGAIDEEYRQYTEYLKQKEGDERQMASILAEIESVASTVNLRLADVKPKKARAMDFYNDFSVSLTIDGELSPILNFLHTLQAPPHFFSVEDVRFEKGAVRTAEIKCRLTLSKAMIP